MSTTVDMRNVPRHVLVKTGGLESLNSTGAFRESCLEKCGKGLLFPVLWELLLGLLCFSVSLFLSPPLAPFIGAVSR